VLRDALTVSSGRLTGSLVGTASLLWGSLKVFRGLDRAFDRVDGTEADPSLLTQLGDGVLSIGAVGVAVACVVAVGTAIDESTHPGRRATHDDGPTPDRIAARGRPSVRGVAPRRSPGSSTPRAP
jgi:hypothetical protein